MIAIVLAAAIKTNANMIVTNNLKDFPEIYLNKFGLKAKSPDNFLTDIIDLNPSEAVNAFKEMVSIKKNPRITEKAMLESMKKADLIETANYLCALM